MNRPHLEVADIVRAHGELFIANNRSWIHWVHQKVLRAIATAVLQSWVDISISAPVVAIAPSFSTPVAIGTAPSVRSRLVGAGSRLAKKNCSPSATST